MRKGQISVEFMFVIGAVIFMFLIILAFSFNKNIEINKTKIYLNQQTECVRFSNFMNSVYIGGDGTRLEYSTNSYITVYPENLIFIDNNAVCSYLGRSQFYNVTGDIAIINNQNNIVIQNV